MDIVLHDHAVADREKSKKKKREKTAALLIVPLTRRISGNKNSFLSSATTFALYDRPNLFYFCVLT